MFAKLLKHEWKATSKLLGTLSLGALGLGLLGAAVLQGIQYSTSKLAVETGASFLLTICTLMLMGLYFALIAYVLGTQIYLIYRFYKTRFTDQGYLTFTLPVSTRSVILSAYVNTLIWMAITIVTVAVAVVLAVVLGRLGSTDLADMWERVRLVFEVAQDDFGGAFIAVSVLGGLLSIASGVMIVMASVTAGAVAAKKHKILAAIGIYYGQGLVLGMLTSAVQVFVTFISFSSDFNMTTYILAYSLVYVIQGAWGLGAYFLTKRLADKKLNLP